MQQAIEWYNSLANTITISDPSELPSKQTEIEGVLFKLIKQALYELLNKRFSELRSLLTFYKIDESVYQDDMKQVAKK